MRRCLLIPTLLLLTLAIACESADAKAERLRTAQALACLPPLDSTAVAQIADSFRVRHADSTAADSAWSRHADSIWAARHPPPTEAERLAAAANACDVATRAYNDFLAGR